MVITNNIININEKIYLEYFRILSTGLKTLFSSLEKILPLVSDIFEKVKTINNENVHAMKYTIEIIPKIHITLTKLSAALGELVDFNTRL